MPRYLQKRRRRWYAVLDIPKSLRPAYDGKPRFVASLETESLTEAERRAPLFIARWKAELEAVRTGDGAPLVHLRETALTWRDLIDEADNETDKVALELILHDKAEEAERSKKNSGIALYKIGTRQWLETNERVEDWLASLEIEQKTIDMRRSDLKRFSERFRIVQRVNRKAVQRWVDDLQTEEGLKLATVRRMISTCRGYWSFLQRNDLASDDSDPFREVVPRSSRRSKKDVATRRRPFTPEDIVRLLKDALKGDDRDLARLIWIGMWTGCRIEEICSLRTEHVLPDRFRVIDAKSEAGWREVPLHSLLMPVVQRLCRESDDGYVLSGLTYNKYGDRSNAIGKRFGRLKTKSGFTGSFVFHSIRMTVATQLDGAGVPEQVSARIVGHDIPTMTYGLYSGGAPMTVKQEAIEKLCYPLGALGPDAL